MSVALPVLENSMRGDLLVLDSKALSTGMLKRLSRSSYKHLVSPAGSISLDSSGELQPRLAGLFGNDALWVARKSFSNYAWVGLEEEALGQLISKEGQQRLEQVLLQWLDAFPGRFEGIVLGLEGDIPQGVSLKRLRKGLADRGLKIGLGIAQFGLQALPAGSEWLPDFFLVRLELPLREASVQSVLTRLQAWPVPFHFLLSDVWGSLVDSGAHPVARRKLKGGVVHSRKKGRPVFEFPLQTLMEWKQSLNREGRFYFSGVGLDLQVLPPRLLLMEPPKPALRVRMKKLGKKIWLSQNSALPSGPWFSDAGVALRLSRHCRLESIESNTARFEVLPSYSRSQVILFHLPGLGAFGETLVGQMGVDYHPQCQIKACGWMRPFGSTSFCSSCSGECDRAAFDIPD